MSTYNFNIKKPLSVYYVLILLCCLGLGTQSMAAQNTNFTEYTGEVLDADSKKALVFATLAVDNTNVTTITNSEGQFSLKVPNEFKGNSLTIAFLGYKTKQLNIADLRPEKNKIFMEEFVMALSEAQIDAPNDAEALVKETLDKKGSNYLDQNTLFVDMVKYPKYIFTPETLNYYDFSFDTSTRVNDQLIYVIDFKQKPEIIDPLYEGKLYIDAENKILTSAIYSLNITDKRLASQMFVRKKPKNAEVWPTEVSYRVDYREKNGKWYYGYSNVLLEFKVNWDKRLFNSVYSMSCEMAVTDWEQNLTNAIPRSKDRMKSSIILSDEALGFADPDFWGEYNIIEPEKSIESAIKKIQRQLRRGKIDNGAAAAR